MKQWIKNLLVCLIVVCMLTGVMTVTAFAAPKKSDTSDTHVYNSDNSSKLPFDKKNITIRIGDKTYRFSASGSGTWKNLDAVPELNLSDEGKDSAVAVVIVDENGNVYDAYLVNHSDKNGNNGNNKQGTDTYDLEGVTLRVDEEPSGHSDSGEPSDPSEPGESSEPTGTEPLTSEVVDVADVPKTGDASLLWAAVSTLAAGGLVLINRKTRQED